MPASEGQIKFVDRKDKMCLKELAKRESEEENNIKDAKSKGKEKRIFNV